MKRKWISKIACTALMSVLSIVPVCTFLSAEPVAAEQVTYRLKWLFNMSVAGDSYADVHQYFQKQGLAVTIKEGGPE